MKNKGITLISLVITIIILLILAGITISQLTGSGLFGNTQLAKEKYENSQDKEELEIAKYNNEINSYINGNRDNILINRSDYETLLNNYNSLSARIKALEDNEKNYITTIPGETYLTNSATVNVANNNTNAITSVEVTPGKWILLGSVNLSCYYNRWASFDGATYTTSSHAYSSDSRNMTMSISGYVETETNKTITLYSGQNSGSTVGISGSIFAIKLAD